MGNKNKRNASASLRKEIDALREQNELLHSQLYDLQAAHRILQGEDKGYCNLVRRIREAVRELVPANGTVLVVSKGDPALVDLYGRTAWHFPRASDGRYAGYYPKHGTSAVAHLETLRASGAEYLLFPHSSTWWLTHYPQLKDHLEDQFRRIDVPDTCVLFALQGPLTAQPPAARLRRLLDDFTPELGDDPSILDWHTGHELATAMPEKRVFEPMVRGDTLPHSDGSVDIVVTDTADEQHAREAERVARKVVLNYSGSPRGRKLTSRAIRWKVKPKPTETGMSVSVVITCADGVTATARCIESLRETLPPWFRGEVIVVDDGTSEGTAAFLEDVCATDGRFAVLREKAPSGVVRSYNRGAGAAKGRFLLFVSNETLLLPRWLSPLLRTFTDFPHAGAVGGKILFEDGVLREAGAMIFSDASVAAVGRADPDVGAPLFECVRETDYVSGAFLMTPHRVFDDLGGFDEQYEAGQYYDADYCLRLRDKGLSTYYQPESIIVWGEPPRLNDAFSRKSADHLSAERVRFGQKWTQIIDQQPPRPALLDSHSVRVHEMGRLRVEGGDAS